jgi:hypothetical protein
MCCYKLGRISIRRCNLYGRHLHQPHFTLPFTPFILFASPTHASANGLGSSSGQQVRHSASFLSQSTKSHSTPCPCSWSRSLPNTNDFFSMLPMTLLCHVYSSCLLPDVQSCPRNHATATEDSFNRYCRQSVNLSSEQTDVKHINRQPRFHQVKRLSPVISVDIPSCLAALSISWVIPSYPGWPLHSPLADNNPPPRFLMAFSIFGFSTPAPPAFFGLLSLPYPCFPEALRNLVWPRVAPTR